MASTVEQKSAQFVAQFAATVFAQWTQTQEKERFWLNAAFLRDLLEEAVAKLPKIALKGHLVRELQPAVAELKKLLEAHYAEHQQHESAAVAKGDKQELLNEEDVERALATADDAKRRELAAVLALDEYTGIATETQEVASVAHIEAYVAQLQRISARSYESPDELARKRGFCMLRIVGCAEQLVAKWAALDKSGNWDCASTSAHGVELQQLRAALQQIVAFDAVTTAASDFGGASSALLPSPWTSFYRPNESPLFLKVDYEAEIAKVFGVLLTLAIYFPVVLDDEDEATSDESSSDSGSDSEPQAASSGDKKQTKLDFLEQAKRTVRHVVFAAKQRSNDALWLVSVLTFLHQLAKPKSYREDGDDELALEAADQRALQDCLCDVYSRAFANPGVLAARDSSSDSRASDWLLFQTVVCLRYAAQFMRSERRQSIPAVTTAMVKLVSVPLPASFWQWLAHVKKLYALQSPQVRDAMKKLTKNKSSKMANALLSATDVTNEELKAVAEVRWLYELGNGWLAWD